MWYGIFSAVCLTVCFSDVSLAGMNLKGPFYRIDKVILECREKTACVSDIPKKAAWQSNAVLA